MHSPRKLHWTESGRGTAWWSGRRSPTTAQTPATARWCPHRQQRDHNGQQTCDQTAATPAQPAIGSPVTPAPRESGLNKSYSLRSRTDNKISLEAQNTPPSFSFALSLFKFHSLTHTMHRSIYPPPPPPPILFPVAMGVGTAQCLEHQTWKVLGSSPSRSGRRIFFSVVNFLCWLLFRYPFHPCVTAVACKRSKSFCWKCRWQVTA